MLDKVTVDKLRDWIKQNAYLVKEDADEEYEKNHLWELSRNRFIDKILTKLDELEANNVRSDKESKIEQKLSDIMFMFNIPVEGGTKKTPERATKALNTLFESHRIPIGFLIEQMTTFKAESQSPVIVKDIPFYSMCEHHLLPFFGTATITYIPDNRILGLSKFARVVKYFSRKAQVQERLTRDIGTFLVYILNPKYLKVELNNCRHMCVEMRGIESTNSTDTVWEYKKEQDEPIELNMNWGINNAE